MKIERKQASAVARALGPVVLAVSVLCSSTLLKGETEEILDKTFSVSPGDRLLTDIESGAVEVNGRAGSEVVIHVWRKVRLRNKAEEEQYLQERPVTMTQEGKTVTIRCRPRGVRAPAWRGRQRFEARYTISIPTQFGVELKTSGGEITISDVAGTIGARTSGGGLKLTRLKGSLEGHTSGGSIHLSECEGPLKIETSGGRIEVEGGGGDLEGKTSGGSVELSDFRGNAEVETGGGGITVKNVTGKIVGSTDGGSIQASLSAPPGGDVNLKTSGGGITLRVPAEAGFELDASASGGGVSSEFPVTAEAKTSKARLKGKVNGGGKTLTLRTDGGGIHIEKF